MNKHAINIFKRGWLVFATGIFIKVGMERFMMQDYLGFGLAIGLSLLVVIDYCKSKPIKLSGG